MPYGLTSAQKRVLDHYRTGDNWRDFASATRHRLAIGGEDVTRRMKTEEGGPAVEGTSGPSLLFAATLSGRHEGIAGRPVELAAMVRDPARPGAEVGFPLFTGEAVRVRVEGGYTDLDAASSGHHHEGTPLGRNMEFPAYHPSTVALEALELLRDSGGYAGVDIAPLKEPRFDAVLDKGFRFDQSVKDLLGELEGQTGLSIRDDPLNVARGLRTRDLLRPGEPIWELEADRDVVGYQHEERTTERYSHVWVVGPDEDATGPLAVAKVDSPGVRFRPLIVETDDPDPVKAEQLAVDEANLLNARAEDADFTVVHPLVHLVRGDTVAITEHERDSERGGRWRRRYLCKVLTYRSTPDKRVECSGVQTLDAEEFVLDQKRGSIPSPVGPYRPPMGRRHDGVPYLDDALGFVRHHPDEKRTAIDEVEAAVLGVVATYEKETLSVALENVS